MAKLSLIALVFLILSVMQSLAVQSIRIEPSYKRLPELKQFLSEFGYLDSYDANIDALDDQIKSAVTLYQMANSLQVTGQLDQETIADMDMPRCGVPDITINEEPQPKWPASKTHLTYTFRSTAKSNKVQTLDLRPACARAFQKWASVSPFTFEEVTEGASPDIEIGFHRGTHGDSSPFGRIGHAKASAHAYMLPTNIGYIHFDADEDWSSEGLPQKNEVDLESVALHEIGHILGLPHSFDRNAVMNSHFMPGTTKRELHGGDVKAIMDLY